MTFTFLDMAGKVLFLRDDAESAQWTVEEMSLDMDFPYDLEKVIAIGQRVYFKDPATGQDQIYEIKQPRSYAPESYQQVHAENIVISELSDEHVDNKEITKQNCREALSDLLNNTLWSVGTVQINPVSTLDISRGSVWQAVLQLQDAYNVAIVPRVTLNDDGTITRKLDILDPKGTFEGLYLSVDKNMIDPCVAFDDSEVATALFGYGGMIQPKDGKGDATECDFSSVVWEKTADHPAKPAGQKYLEDKEATAAYGRNGRPRYGFYQNTDITDPEELLEKTWETLKTVRVPALSIEGTVSDLYRLGYADTPLTLRTIAIVEIQPFGFKTELQLIRMVVDLLDPTGTMVNIGSYIPNIIYIERKTNENATGSRGGGGGNKGKETAWREFVTTIDAYANGTGLKITAVQNDIENQAEEVAKRFGEIEVTYESIRLEVNDLEEGVNSKITVLKNRIDLVVTDEKNPKIKPAQIVASINNGASSILLSADHINIDGVVEKLQSYNISCGDITGDAIKGQSITAVDGGTVAGGSGDFDMLSVDDTFDYDGHDVDWKQATVVTSVTRSNTRNMVYAVNGNISNLATMLGSLVTDVSTTTIYYLGR